MQEIGEIILGADRIEFPFSVWRETKQIDMLVVTRGDQHILLEFIDHNDVYAGPVGTIARNLDEASLNRVMIGSRLSLGQVKSMQITYHLSMIDDAIIKQISEIAIMDASNKVVLTAEGQRSPVSMALRN